MKKTAVFLLLVVGLMVSGLALSFYGSQIITEDLVSNTQLVSQGDSLEVFTELDPQISNKGVYVVQIMQFERGSVTAKIFDPFGTQIISENIDKDSFEGRFDIDSKGKYKLLIENKGKETEIIGVIGHLPDTSKFSIGISGFYLLIVGMIGMVGIAIFVIRNRKKVS